MRLSVSSRMSERCEGRVMNTYSDKAIDERIIDGARRVKAEYLEMPGLKLTRHQAARLCGLDSRVCDAVLAALVRDRFLVCTRSDAFVRQD